MKRLLFFLPLILTLALTACSGSAAIPTAIPTIPLATQIPTAIPGPTPVLLALDAATYRNDALGFEFDYPARWIPSDLVTIGDRADQVEFTAPEGQVLSLVIYRWDPVGDLQAYLDHRRSAWDASGMTVLAEQSLTLAGGWSGVSLILQNQDGSWWYVGYVPVGDRYLEFSSSAGYDLLREIVSTIRPVTAP
jgi:hypothetical protein